MYKEIEREYLKTNPEKNFNFYYVKMSIVVGVIFYVLFYINHLMLVKILLFILMTIILLLGSIRFYQKDFKNHLSEEEKRLNLLNRFKRYFNYIDNIKRKNLINILKEQNINTEKKLELMINYYNKKSPIKIETGFWGGILTLFISLASLVAVGYNDNTNKFDSEKLTLVLSSAFGMIFMGLITYFLIKGAISLLKPSPSELYSELENNLTYLRINFEKNKDKLQKSTIPAKKEKTIKKNLTSKS